MELLTSEERAFLDSISQLAYSNPFLPERTGLERAALGSAHVEREPIWSFSVTHPDRPRENVWRIAKKLEPLTEELRARFLSGRDAGDGDLVLYEDAAIHLLYQRYYSKFLQAGTSPSAGGRWSFYKNFLADWRHFFSLEGVRLPTGHEPRHTFSCFRQIQRAFEQIYRAIIGGSMPAARLRAAIWQSIFTCDMRRYRRTLYERMGEFATLITGPSGTGKELAASAIAHSRYVAFDEQTLTFPGDDTVGLYAINISALSPSLVESELFGHRRGAFTGAVRDRKGWLETCPALGSVFLDELGDLDPAIQVKLLRVIETRSFHLVGDTAAVPFRGKLIAATNRDLGADIRSGRFREDLYYRLCSDLITTPSLAEQIADSPEVLVELVTHMALRIAGAEADGVAQDALAWIGRNLASDYPWPGNYRELDQCVRNVLIRRDYRPSSPPQAGDGFEEDFRAGRLTAQQLLAQYCTRVYAQTGSYEETARRLGLDRRTVRANVNRDLLDRLRPAQNH